MEDFRVMIETAVNLMKVPFTLWGFTMNFWDIMLFGLIAGVILSLLWGYMT